MLIASRIEQLNKKYKSKLIISEEVYSKLENKKNLPTNFTEENVKGRKETVRILAFQ